MSLFVESRLASPICPSHEIVKIGQGVTLGWGGIYATTGNRHVARSIRLFTERRRDVTLTNVQRQLVQHMECLLEGQRGGGSGSRWWGNTTTSSGMRVHAVKTQ